MSRQEATNVFSEGMVKDLNPLNTPNNLLTDCLNGTIITYNGNEFILQNDQGNYKLEHAKLNSNFIPVGIKEYANILYIVSYNPITKETEVGSYPSPRTIFTTKDRDHKVIFVPIIPTELKDDDGLTETRYTKLIQSAKLQLYALSDDMENYKLNPGDKFIILIKENEDFKYQEIEFAILTDDKNLVPINIPKDEGYFWPINHPVDDEDFKPVFWEIPGWLTGKYRLAVMNQFFLNIRNIEIPEFIIKKNKDEIGIIDDIKISLNAQMEISDDLFRSRTNETLQDLQVEYRAYKRDSNGVESPLFPKNKSGSKWLESLDGRRDYTSINSIFFQNFDIEFDEKVELTIYDTIYIEAVPVLWEVKDISGVAHTIYYDQFKTTLEFNLAAIMDANDIIAANIIYKYFVDDDSVTMTFNVAGPFINNSRIKMYIELYSLYGADKDNIKVDKLVYDRPQEEVNFFGQNTFDLEYKDGIGEGFEPENMYIMSIVFKQGEDILKRVNKLLIASELFNDFINTHIFYDDIYLDEWLPKYINTYRNIEFITPPPTNTPPKQTLSYLEWSPIEGSWPNGIKFDMDSNPKKFIYPPDRPYNWFVDSFVPPKAPSYSYGSNVKSEYKFDSKYKILTGKLWENRTINNKLSFKSNFGSKIEDKDAILINQNILSGDSFINNWTWSTSNYFGASTNLEFVQDGRGVVTIIDYIPIYVFQKNTHRTSDETIIDGIPNMIVSTRFHTQSFSRAIWSNYTRLKHYDNGAIMNEVTLLGLTNQNNGGDAWGTGNCTNNFGLQIRRKIFNTLGNSAIILLEVSIQDSNAHVREELSGRGCGRFKNSLINIGNTTYIPLIRCRLTQTSQFWFVALQKFLASSSGTLDEMMKSLENLSKSIFIINENSPRKTGIFIDLISKDNDPNIVNTINLNNFVLNITIPNIKWWNGLSFFSQNDKIYENIQILEPFLSDLETNVVSIDSHNLEYLNDEITFLNQNIKIIRSIPNIIDVEKNLIIDEVRNFINILITSHHHRLKIELDSFDEDPVLNNQVSANGFYLKGDSRYMDLRNRLSMRDGIVFIDGIDQDGFLAGVSTRIENNDYRSLELAFYTPTLSIPITQ